MSPSDKPSELKCRNHGLILNHSIEREGTREISRINAEIRGKMHKIADQKASLNLT